jgi:glycine/sarcosine N-methyltransferase
MNKEMYDDFSQDYDRFVNWQERLAIELPFIEQQLQIVERKINRKPKLLDAACGSGMHAIALARLGYSACGSDISPKMVGKARDNARAAGVNAKFIESAFGNLKHDFQTEPEFPFDVILCLGNSLPHLLTIIDLRKALQDIADCLQPGGMAFFQNRNFDAVMEKKQRWMEPQNHVEGSQEWVFLRFYDFERDGLITFNILRLQRSGTEAWQQIISSTKLYPLKRDTLTGLLEESGFTDIRCFGGMAEEPFDPITSGNLVVSANKK